jgi:hypothetical protein
MINLWVPGEGWKAFEHTDTAELEKRGIHIGNRASIGDGAKPICVCITGSRFPVYYWGEDRIDIGCKSRSIDEWLTDSTDIASLAKEYNFTLEAVAEYRGYVEFIKSIHLGQTSVNQTA